MNVKLLFLTSFLFAAGATSAQDDFASLPAKVKTQLAEEEEIASENDAVFQDLMSQGMLHFENNEFEDAISLFDQAGKLRPINVYPPVMIEDVKLAISLYVEEEAEKPKEKPKEIPKEQELTAKERVELMYQQELAKVYDTMPAKPKKEKTEPLEEQPERNAEGLIMLEDQSQVSLVEEEIEEVIEEEKAFIEEILDPIKKVEAVAVKKQEIQSTEELQTELAEEFPDGVTEEQFKEGNRTITRRIVVKDGSGNEYRRVAHGWGGIFYFKNGDSISERAWNDETATKD